MVETTQSVVDNKVVCRGRVSGFGRDRDGRRVIDIYIRQGYQAPPLTVEFLYRDLPEDVEVGDFVEVEGYVQAGYIRTSESQEHPTYSQAFVAEKITHLKTEIQEAFGVDGGFSYGHMFFRAYFKGAVARVTDTPGSVKDANGRARKVTFTRVLIRTAPRRLGRTSSIVSAQFTSRMRVADKKPNRGDEVVVVANLSSREKRNSNGELVTFYNLIIDDLVVTAAAPEETQSSAPATNNKVVNKAPQPQNEQKEEVKAPVVEAPSAPAEDVQKEEKVEDKTSVSFDVAAEAPSKDVSTPAEDANAQPSSLHMENEDDEGDDLF